MKKTAINEKLCQGKDVFERMNYLHQASLLVSSQNTALASYYGSILSGCAKKSVLRIDHNLKRSMCKACHNPLIPGETAKVRLMSRKKKMIKIVCCGCNNAKKIPTKNKHNLWTDQPQAVLETFVYSLKKKANTDTKDDALLDGNKKDKRTTNASVKSNGVQDIQSDKNALEK